MTGFFFVPSSNAAKVFELAKHAFDDVTLFIQVPVAASLFFAIGFGWNHCRNLTLFKPIKQGIGFIPLVSQERARTTVLSMQTFSKSAWADTWASILSQTSNLRQLAKRVKTLFQCPNLSGRSPTARLRAKFRVLYGF